MPANKNIHETEFYNYIKDKVAFFGNHCLKRCRFYFAEDCVLFKKPLEFEQCSYHVRCNECKKYFK